MAPRKKTHEEFIRELFDISPDIEVLTQYVASEIKVSCRCKCCNNIWPAKPTKLLQGRGCPECAKKRVADSVRNSTEKVINRVHTVNPNIRLIGEYKTCDTPIECECLVCGYHWSPTVSNLYAGKGCPKCSKTYHRSHEEFVSELAEKNPDIIVKGRFVNTYTGIEFECRKCGYVWHTTPSSVLSGNGCRNCACEKRRRTIQNNNAILNCVTGKRETDTDTNKMIVRSFTVSPEIFKEEVYKHAKNADIEMLDEYINSKTRIECKCRKCNYVWKPLPQTLKKGIGCPQCNRRVKTDSFFKQQVRNLNLPVEVLSEYMGAFEDVTCRCKQCGSTFEISAHSLLQGHGCRKCAIEKNATLLRKTHEQFVNEIKEFNPVNFQAKCNVVE